MMYPQEYQHVVALDVDGVTLDIVTPWLKIYESRTGHHLKHDDIRTWMVSETATELSMAEHFEIIRDPRLYEQVQPYPGVVEAVELLKEHNFLVLFISDIFPGVYKAKSECLMRHGLMSFDRDLLGIQSHFKKNFMCGALVDDKPETVYAHQNGVMMLQPWNANILIPEGKGLIYTWLNPEHALDTIQRSCYKSVPAP